MKTQRDISRRFYFALLFILTSALGLLPARASQVCMNTSNGNGGLIAYYPYLFNNNTFGWSNDESGSTECLTLNYTNAANNGVYYDGFGATWNWPDKASTQYDVKAYPSIVYGWQYGYTYSGLGLPTIIYDNENVPTYASLSITGTQSEDVIVDNWLLDSPNATAQAAEVEIYITDTFAKQTSGNLGSITLDGVFYYVSSASRGAWEAYSFIPNQNSTSLSASPNVKDFDNALCYDFGVISNDLYLGGTQIGLEVYQGQGGITFNPAAVSVN